MPLQKCSSNGKPGWKWGSQGKCYTGSKGKLNAAKQGLAIIEGGYKEPGIEKEKKELLRVIGIEQNK